MMEIKTIQLEIKGMTCDHCAQTIEKELNSDGIIKKAVSYKEKSALVEFDKSLISEDKIIKRINGVGHYRVTGMRDISSKGNSQKHLIIIGGGSAAFAATIQAHELGVRVSMINSGLAIGGTCVNVGCVPSKNLIRVAEALHRSQNTPFEGIETNGRLVDFRKVIAQKQELVNTLRQEKYVNVIKDMDNFEFIEGHAKLISENTVEVNGQKISGDAILIATGATSAIPPIPGLEESGYLTNETAFELYELPDHVIVLGGNYIGLETAQMFSRLGSNVSVVELMPQILPREMPDVAFGIQKYLEGEGISFYTNARTERVFKDGDKTVLKINQNGSEILLKGSHLVVATGRKANTRHLGLEEVGVELDDRGFLKVDPFLQTNIAGIYGAGDVIGGFMFVYAAAYEGKLAVSNAFSTIKKEKDYTALPWVVFTDPQVAGVGLDEVQAELQGIDAEASMLELKYVPRSIAAKDTRGFIKLIRDKKTDKLIGARILAAEGSELLMEIAMAIKYGITTEQVKEMFHPYLTLSEGIKLAAITFSKNVKELSCCAT